MEDQNVHKKGQTIHFFARISTYPIVHDGASALQAMANNSAVGRLMLSTTQSALETITSYMDNHPSRVHAYYNRFVQPHVARMDAMGCRSLDLLQKKIPAINKPTADFVLVFQRPTQELVVNAKVQANHAFCGVMQPIRAAAEKTNAYLGGVVDHVEAAVDLYLPGPAESEQNTVKRAWTAENQAVRAYIIVQAIMSRLKHRAFVKLVAFSRPCVGIFEALRDSPIAQSVGGSVKFYRDTLTHSFTVYGQAVRERVAPAVARKFKQMRTISYEQLQFVRNQVPLQLDQVRSALTNQSNVFMWIWSRVEDRIVVAKKQLEYIHTEHIGPRAIIGWLTLSSREAYENQIKRAFLSTQSQFLQANHLAKVDFSWSWIYFGLHAMKLQ